MKKQYRSIIFLIAIFALTGIMSSSVLAQQSDKEKAKQVKKAAETAKNASKVLNELMKIPASSIPAKLLKDARAIAVFPKVIKAAFGIGGAGGQGLISRRIKGGWSAPVAFKIASGSVGLQIGATSTDYVMLFMSDDSLKNLLEDKFEMGAEGSVAAGPVGRTAAATTNAQLEAEILTYSRAKGLFAGISLKGGVLSPDNDRNQALYGMDSKELLTGANKIAIADIPAATKGLQQTITAYAK